MDQFTSIRLELSALAQLQIAGAEYLGRLTQSFVGNLACADDFYLEAGGCVHDMSRTQYFAHVVWRVGTRYADVR